MNGTSTSFTSAGNSPLDHVPDADSLRLRLAHLVTEAALIRAQLRVSRRLEQERERLKRLDHCEG